MTWDSAATLGPVDLDRVMVAIRPDDGLPNGAGEPSYSPAFSIRNNSPPIVFLIEPVANPDSEGAIRLRFRLRDLEGDPADAILQWSAEADDFPDIADLALDRDLRRRVLLDPDERAPRRIITPRVRAIIEARSAGSQVAGQVLPADEILLADIIPPAAITPAVFQGATLELLSDAGAVMEMRTIVGAGPALRKLKLAGPLDSPSRPWQRIRVRESISKLLFDLPASARSEGLEYAVA